MSTSLLANGTTGYKTVDTGWYLGKTKRYKSNSARRRMEFDSAQQGGALVATRQALIKERLARASKIPSKLTV